jgi:hypothetical protein
MKSATPVRTSSRLMPTPPLRSLLQLQASGEKRALGCCTWFGRRPRSAATFLQIRSATPCSSPNGSRCRSEVVVATWHMRRGAPRRRRRLDADRSCRPSKPPDRSCRCFDATPHYRSRDATKGQSDRDPSAHCATVSFRTRAIGFKCAIFSFMSRRCAAATSRTSPQGAFRSSTRRSSAHISSKVKPSSLARSMNRRWRSCPESQAR